MAKQPIPINDDEIVMRRIPVSMDWYADGVLKSEAFEPRRDDHSGISVYRKRFRSLEEVAQGKSKRGYYVVSLRVSDLHAAGIAVEPHPEVPEGWDDAHAEIPALNAGIRRTNVAAELQSRLAEIGTFLPVEGPFVAEADT